MESNPAPEPPPVTQPKSQTDPPSQVIASTPLEVGSPPDESTTPARRLVASRTLLAPISFAVLESKETHEGELCQTPLSRSSSLRCPPSSGSLEFPARSPSIKSNRHAVFRNEDGPGTPSPKHSNLTDTHNSKSRKHKQNAVVAGPMTANTHGNSQERRCKVEAQSKELAQAQDESLETSGIASSLNKPELDQQSNICGDVNQLASVISALLQVSIHDSFKAYVAELASELKTAKQDISVALREMQSELKAHVKLDATAVPQKRVSTSSATLDLGSWNGLTREPTKQVTVSMGDFSKIMPRTSSEKNITSQPQGLHNALAATQRMSFRNLELSMKDRLFEAARLPANNSNERRTRSTGFLPHGDQTPETVQNQKTSSNLQKLKQVIPQVSEDPESAAHVQCNLNLIEDKLLSNSDEEHDAAEESIERPVRRTKSQNTPSVNMPDNIISRSVSCAPGRGPGRGAEEGEHISTLKRSKSLDPRNRAVLRNSRSLRILREKELTQQVRSTMHKIEDADLNEDEKDVENEPPAIPELETKQNSRLLHCYFTLGDILVRWYSYLSCCKPLSEESPMISSLVHFISVAASAGTVVFCFNHLGRHNAIDSAGEPDFPRLVSDVALAIGAFLGLFACGALKLYTSVGKCIDLLQAFADSQGFSEDWKKKNRGDAILASLLWCIAFAERARCVATLTNHSQEDRSDGVLSCIAFAVFSGLLTAEVLNIMRVCRALSIVVDDFALRMVQSGNFAAAEKEWNVSQAIIRSACTAVQVVFLIIQSTVVAAIILGVADFLIMQGEHRDYGSQTALTSGGILILGLTQMFLRASGVTDHCTRLPSFINSLSFGDTLDASRMYIVDYIVHSQAGFYVFEVRLTSDLVLKTMYLGLTAIGAIVTKIVLGN